MSKYYCHECARNLGLIVPVDSSTLEANPGGKYPYDYQWEKYVKHTVPTEIYSINSVFLNSTWNSYQHHMVSAMASGCLEIDDWGRKNLILFAGSTTGMQYNNGMFASTCSGVMAVLTENSTMVHAFPCNFHPESRSCEKCGRPVPFDPRK